MGQVCQGTDDELSRKIDLFNKTLLYFDTLMSLVKFLVAIVGIIIIYFFMNSAKRPKIVTPQMFIIFMSYSLEFSLQIVKMVYGDDEDSSSSSILVKTEFTLGQLQNLFFLCYNWLYAQQYLVAAVNLRLLMKMNDKLLGNDDEEIRKMQARSKKLVTCFVVGWYTMIIISETITVLIAVLVKDFKPTSSIMAVIDSTFCICCLYIFSVFMISFNNLKKCVESVNNLKMDLSKMYLQFTVFIIFLVTWLIRFAAE